MQVPRWPVYDAMGRVEWAERERMSGCGCQGGEVTGKRPVRSRIWGNERMNGETDAFGGGREKKIDDGCDDSFHGHQWQRSWVGIPVGKETDNG